MRTFMFNLLLLAVLNTPADAQSHPVLSGTLKAGGVMSRNTELIKVLEFSPASEDQFEVAGVKYSDGIATRWKQILVTSHSTDISEGYDAADCIRIVDVTNPRSPNDDYIRIYVKPMVGDSALDTITASFGILQVFTDQQEPESGTFRGDVFLLAWVGEAYQGRPGGLPIKPDGTKSGDTLDPKARFLIVNLSRAVALRETGPDSVNIIEIPDAGVRRVTYNGTDDPNVYVGYIASDYSYFKIAGSNDLSVQQKPHALNVDQEAAIMTINPVPSKRFSATTSLGQQPFYDAFDLRQLASISVLTAPADPSEVVRLSTVMTIDTTNYTVPLLLPAFERNSEQFTPAIHEISIRKIGADSVRFFIASASGFKVHNNVGVASGVVILDVDYSTPTQCVTSNEHFWPYDSDRRFPGRRFTQDTASDLTNNWWWRICHTAAPFVHTEAQQPFLLTADELASPHANPLSTPALTLSGGVYQEGGRPAILNLDDDTATADYENDLRIGSLLRIWNTQYNAGALEVAPRGSGNDDGPLVLYDAPESEDPDDLYYSSVRTLRSTTGIPTSISSHRWA